MQLSVSDTTMREIAGDESVFPGSVRAAICKAVRQITIEDMNRLSGLHESDPDNFDGTIEANLRELLPPDTSINANCHVTKTTRFNSDLVIRSKDSSVCLEIEKGYMSRFELDILKMQAFAAAELVGNAESGVFGAFIVPADNVVASHISGNAREHSFKYLSRLSRLLAEIQPPPLADILIVGYSTSAIQMKTARVKKPNRTLPVPTDNVITADAGLLDTPTIQEKIPGRPLDLAFRIRDQLASRFPELREKLNCNSRYLGYTNGRGSDALYVYIQKKQLLLDIRVSKEEAENLRNKGVTVVPRNNYQSKAGWLTGVLIPHDTRPGKLQPILELAVLALEG